MSPPSRNVVVLKSSDGVRFEIEEAVAAQLQTVKAMIEDDDCSMMRKTIPLLHITSTVLGKVIDYCKKSSRCADSNWKQEFVKLVDAPTLFDIVLAANYLQNKSLFDLTCQAVADMMDQKGQDKFNRGASLV